MEKNFGFWNIDVQKLNERMNERQKPEKPLALDANGSDEPLMLCRLEIPEQAPDFQPATSSPCRVASIARR